MTAHRQINSTGGAKAEPDVPCAKCDELNPSDKHVCRVCGAHLYVSCHNCGQINPRVSPRCSQCGQRLHRSFVRKWQKKFFTKTRGKISPFQIALLVIAVAVAYKIIVMIAEYRPPPPQ